MLGLGNYLMGDEGIGVQVIQEMAKREMPHYVDLLDGGTGGFLLLSVQTAGPWTLDRKLGA